jgi:hypothetical protein
MTANISYSQDLAGIRLVQSNNYELQHWDQFFGTAIAYRRYLYRNNPNNSLIYLEAMALIKHCQFELARNLMNSLSDQSSKLIPEDKLKIEKIMNFIPGIQNLTINTKGVVHKRPLMDSNRWAIFKTTDGAFQKSIPINAYRSHVDNICRK